MQGLLHRVRPHHYSPPPQQPHRASPSPCWCGAWTASQRKVLLLMLLAILPLRTIRRLQ
jgi:hypothetical protein